jgi:hypothetical protein
MLKIQYTENTPALILNITGTEDSTQREDLYKGYLAEVTKSAINPIFDNEVTEFKPESAEVEFNIFFSAYKNTDWLAQLKPYVEENFTFHLNDSVRLLAGQSQEQLTNPKTLQQQTGIPTPPPVFKFHKKKAQLLEEEPYVVLDPVVHLTESKPTSEGVPVFYNSFALPFAKKLAKWGEDPMGFSNKSFLYNSFLLLDFYTTNNPLTQKKVMSIPVYVNGRYMAYEQNGKQINQVRPAMYLNNATEGYSLIWLRNHQFNKLYVKFSFWDALSGEQITLIPSSDLSTHKKWVQNPKTFKTENLYLEYTFDYTNKQYKIREYNDSVDAYNIITTSFDLYQLVYDEFFSKLNRIPNTKPFRNAVTDTEVAGDDINLFMSSAGLDVSVDATFNDVESSLTHIDRAYNQKHRSLMVFGLHNVFQRRKVALRDKALGFFDRQFSEAKFYTQNLGTLSLTNSTDKTLLVRKMEVKNVRIENKNNFIEGQPIVVNQFTRTSVDQLASDYTTNTFFTFKGSSFFRKLNSLRQPFDSVENAIFNKQADMYSHYYYDEENNKVAEKSPEDINALVQQLTQAKKETLFKNLLMGGVGVFKWIKQGKQQEARIKGLTMNEKDLNTLLRSDVLEKSGGKQGYELLFPATNEKLVKKTEEYRDYGVTINTKLSPQFTEFEKGLTMNLTSEINFGNQFFKLFISANDMLTIKYDVVIQLVDDLGNSYKKIIPCVLKYT